MPVYYEIKIKGHLDPLWLDWFTGLTVINLEGDVTLISGLLPDQAALHGLLERIRNLNLTLLTITRGGSSACVSDKELKGNGNGKFNGK